MCIFIIISEIISLHSCSHHNSWLLLHYAINSKIVTYYSQNYVWRLDNNLFTFSVSLILTERKVMSPCHYVTLSHLRSRESRGLHIWCCPDSRTTFLMSPWFEGNIAMSPSPYKGFVEGPIFIINVGGFDHGFYLSKQLKELIYSKDKICDYGF